MERPAGTREGCKRRCTDAAMEYFKAEVMEMCHREKLRQFFRLPYGIPGNKPQPDKAGRHPRCPGSLKIKESKDKDISRFVRYKL